MNAIKIKERLKYYNILSIKYEENENNYYQGSLILFNEKNTYLHHVLMIN